MFVHDPPSAVNLAETHGQPKIEGFTFSLGRDANAMPYCRSKGNILTASDLHIVKREANRLF